MQTKKEYYSKLPAMKITIKRECRFLLINSQGKNGHLKLECMVRIHSLMILKQTILDLLETPSICKYIFRCYGRFNNLRQLRYLINQMPYKNSFNLYFLTLRLSSLRLVKLHLLLRFSH